MGIVGSLYKKLFTIFLLALLIEPESLRAADLAYIIQNGDQIEIIIESPLLFGRFNNPQTSFQTVRPDGKLSVSVIGDDVLAVGKNVEQIQESMEKAFEPHNPWKVPIHAVVHVIN